MTTRPAREAGSHEEGSPIAGSEELLKYFEKDIFMRKTAPVAIKMDCKRRDCDTRTFQ